MRIQQEGTLSIPIAGFHHESFLIQFQDSVSYYGDGSTNIQTQVEVSVPELDWNGERNARIDWYDKWPALPPVTDTGEKDAAVRRH